MVFLNQGVMPFAHDLSRLIVDDHAANGAAAFVIALLCEKHSNPYEISVGPLLEKFILDDLWKTPRGKIHNRVQDLVGNGRISRNKCLHENSFRGRM